MLFFVRYRTFDAARPHADAPTPQPDADPRRGRPSPKAAPAAKAAPALPPKRAAFLRMPPRESCYSERESWRRRA